MYGSSIRIWILVTSSLEAKHPMVNLIMLIKKCYVVNIKCHFFRFFSKFNYWFF